MAWHYWQTTHFSPLLGHRTACTSCFTTIQQTLLQMFAMSRSLIQVCDLKLMDLEVSPFRGTRFLVTLERKKPTGKLQLLCIFLLFFLGGGGGPRNRHTHLQRFPFKLHFLKVPKPDMQKKPKAGLQAYARRGINLGSMAGFRQAHVPMWPGAGRAIQKLRGEIAAARGFPVDSQLTAEHY